MLVMTTLVSCDKQEQRARPVATVGESLHGKIDEKDFLYSYELTEVRRRRATGPSAAPSRVRAEPQVWSTAVRPIRAPRCLGSAALVIMVSALALNRMS